ncbi:MAG TPA: hypothetical protein VMD25_06675 [Acidobacteriaceae bacterium]|nr:hypothetical protein [Acidobacteriaceae bacterium]
MKYSVFEQAGVEARAGIKEIDATIDRLKAQRELLEVLESVVRQVLTVVPMSTEVIPARAIETVAVVPDAPAAEQPPVAAAPPEGRSGALRMDEWPAGSPSRTPPDDASEPPSLADLISHGKPQALREERWPTWPPDDERRIRDIL